MPTYEYERADGTRFELRQGFHDAPLTVDPETGQAVRRILSPAPVIFKGSGWYITDSRPSSASSESSAASASSTSSDSKPAASTTDTPAASSAATESKPAASSDASSTPAKKESA